MRCSPAPGRAKTAAGQGRQAGQVLLIAVMLMTAILLLGALFVAIVNYNQYQSTRHGDVLLARALAEAGIRYADYMLQHSPLGADWRPPTPPMYDVHLGTYDPGFNQYYLPEEIARGYHGIRDSGLGTIVRMGFTRYPDPLGTTASASADLPDIGWDQGHILLRVTYDPDPPFEQSDTGNTPDKLSKYIKIEAVGVVMGRAAIMHRLVAYKPIGLTDYLLWVTDKTNTGRPAYLGIQPFIDFDNSGTVDIRSTAPNVYEAGEFLVMDYDGPIRINTHLQLVGANLSGNALSGGALDPAWASNQIRLTVEPVPPGGYLRDDRLEVTDGISDPAQGTVGAATVPGQTTAVWRVTAAGAAGPDLLWPSDDPRFNTISGRVVDGAETQDPTGQSRFVKRLAAPDAFAPDPVTGAERYRALTRDSGPLVALASGGHAYAGSLGHGPPEGGMYIDNFDDVQFVDSNGQHDLDSLIQDWLRQIPPGDPRASQSGWNAMGTLYVPPGVEIELCDSEQMASQGRTIVTSRTNPPTSPNEVWWPGHVAGEPGIRLIRHDKHWACVDGTDSGLNEMVIDYPQWPHAVIFAEGNIRIKGILPRARRNLDGTLARDYNLTVVSGGTIYIDGQILSPRDVDGTVPDEDDTKIALIARDHVCLNTTMIVAQNKSGLVPAAPDDPANPDPDHMHWDLAPGAGYVWSSWMFGATPENQIDLFVQHTGADPGPSGVGMNVRDTGTGTMQPYDFGGGFYVYKLVPPGVPFAGPGSNTIAPAWETARWELHGVTQNVIDINPGAYNALALFHRDPGIAPGSTDYWLKKWKLQEFASVGGRLRPTGTVHARINAVVYAQNGCWFVIPGTYFDPDAPALDADGDGVPESVLLRRYNYEITFRGCITENYTAPPEAVQEWMDKWAFPVWPDANTVCWASIRYVYDETVRAGRDQPAASLVGNVRRSSSDPRSEMWNLPRLPLLPVSPDLIYFGQAW